MTQVEVLYWWQRPLTERQSAPPKTKIQKLEKKKGNYVWRGAFFPKVGQTMKIIWSMFVILCGNKHWQQTNSIPILVKSVLANQLVQKLYACTVAQVPSTVVQRLALDRLRQLFSPNPLVWKMDPSLRRNGKEHRRQIRELSLDKMMSNWTTDDKLNDELADDDNFKELRKKFKVVRPNCTACLVTNEPAVRGEVNTGKRKIN